MANYAFLDNQNIVTEVITGRDEDEVLEGVLNWEDYYGEIRGQTCLRTSYNGSIRKNYAGIGYKYDSKLNAFIPPKPFDSWILDKKACNWKAPSPKPSHNSQYVWNEENTEWDKII